MKQYLLLAAVFVIGISIGVLITPSVPKGYKGFVSVELCQEQIEKVENITERCIEIASEMASELKKCRDSK